MRLPRLTRLSTVEFTMRNGMTIRQEFQKLKYTADASAVTKLSWTSSDKLFFIIIKDIVSIKTVSERRVIKIRYADE